MLDIWNKTKRYTLVVWKRRRPREVWILVGWLMFGRRGGVEIRESVKLMMGVVGGQFPTTVQIHVYEIRNYSTPTHFHF